MNTRRILRWCLSLVVMVAVAGGGYTYVHYRVSDRVRVEMLAVVNDMAVPAAARDEIRQRLSLAHNQAFSDALSLTNRKGQQFDHEAYFKQVFDAVIASYRAEGRNDLADTLDDERRHFTFSVTEG